MAAGAAASSPCCLPKLGWAAEPLCGLRPPPPPQPCSSQERSLLSARLDGGGEAQGSTISRGGLYGVQHILKGATSSPLFLWKLRPKEEELWFPVTQQSRAWTGPPCYWCSHGNSVFTPECLPDRVQVGHSQTPAREEREEASAKK